MALKNQVQLITYPDSLGGDLHTLNSLLKAHFVDIFPGGVHILPPYPSSGDRGFAPLTYFEIDPTFGTWEDVQAIARRFDVILDLMVNHISRRSAYFQDFTARGRQSPYADMVLTLDKVWPNGEPNPEDVARIFLRRPEHPFAEVDVRAGGEKERVWATFGTRDWSEQIDLDVRSHAARQMFGDILGHFSRQDVKMVRLDAVAYVIKKPGTSCFFVEPEIYSFMDWIRAEADAVGIELLPEVHATLDIQMKLAAHGYWVYNFALPLLILHALLRGSDAALKAHLQACPRKQVTMLDCHDGIPVVPDVVGLLPLEEAHFVVETCLQRGANLNRILSAKHRPRADFDAHQINITYYSALGMDDDAYITARAIQFFAPGIPQVYYVGLLAGENDPEAVQRTGEGRAINRHDYTAAEVEASLQKPVVQRLLELIRLRNTHPAFQGTFSLLTTGDAEIGLAWENGEQRCTLHVDLPARRAEVNYTGENGLPVVFQP